MARCLPFASIRKKKGESALVGAHHIVGADCGSVWQEQTEGVRYLVCGKLCDPALMYGMRWPFALAVFIVVIALAGHCTS